MFSRLIQNMIEQYHYPVLDTIEVHDDFVAKHEESVLFFTENAERFPESNDVAMILPELVKEYDGRFQAAVIALPCQRPLQSRYGFTEWPTLVFMRGDRHLGNISRVQDWNQYILMINQLLVAEPKTVVKTAIPPVVVG